MSNLEGYIGKIDLQLRQRSTFPPLKEVLKEHVDLFIKENLALYNEHDFIMALNTYELLVQERYFMELIDDEGRWDA